MMKSILYLLSDVVWPMEIKNKLLVVADQKGFYFSQQPFRKASESIGSKTVNSVPAQKDGSPAINDNTDRKTKKKIEILDVFF